MNMMDSSMIKAISKVIQQSDMSDLSLITVNERPIEVYRDADGTDKYNVNICVSDVIGSEKIRLSEAWVASNILIFTAFDGFLENKYNLVEGDSFRNHYLGIQATTSIERIEKDCYRILKIIRNGIQHNLSSVTVNGGAYRIAYQFKSTHFKLEMSKQAMRLLYTITMNVMNGSINGLYSKYSTRGHFEGILNSMYAEMCKGIMQLSDDFTDSLYGNGATNYRFDATHLRASVRYPVENPTILHEDDDSILFRFINNNGSNNGVDSIYKYSGDYVYGVYLLPEEMGIITNFTDENKQGSPQDTGIRFMKADIGDVWRLPNS